MKKNQTIALIIVMWILTFLLLVFAFRIVAPFAENIGRMIDEQDQAQRDSGEAEEPRGPLPDVRAGAGRSFQRVGHGCLQQNAPKKAIG